MAFEPQLLAPIEGGGLVEYYKPWLIGREAFPRLEDAYCWRGTVKKREGFILLGDVGTNLPIVGLTNFIIPSTGQGRLITFSQTAVSTQKAFVFNNTTEVFDDVSFFSDASPVTWSGTNLDYFYSCNFQRSLWVTNFVDNIRFWNGNTANGWSTQFPEVEPGIFLETCQIILPYRGRLLTLNTVENGISYRQRARWAQIGTSYVTTTNGDPAVAVPSPFSTDDEAWRDDIPGKGGYIDADTSERIIGAGIVRDTLVVFFQRSTWRLRYTGNEVLPFLWERINTQYGADSSFSTIEFDDNILTFSRFGFIAADTNGTKRIDEKIPDQSFQFIELGDNIKQLQRIQGIRDFYRQTAYWAYPDATTNSDFPNKVLAFNYIDKTWSRFKQSFTCFGYYQTFEDVTWASLNVTPEDLWQNSSWPWNAPANQSNFPNVVAGNSTGQVYVVYDILQNGDDDGTNFGFLIDTKFLNPYIEQGLRCRLQYMDIYCDSAAHGQITVQLFVDDNMDTPIKTVIVNTDLTTSNAKYVRVYLGAIARVHRIRMTLSDAQIADAEIGTAPFVIQGLVLWTRAEGRLKR